MPTWLSKHCRALVLTNRQTSKTIYLRTLNRHVAPNIQSVPPTFRIRQTPSSWRTHLPLRRLYSACLSKRLPMQLRCSIHSDPASAVEGLMPVVLMLDVAPTRTVTPAHSPSHQKELTSTWPNTILRKYLAPCKQGGSTRIQRYAPCGKRCSLSSTTPT